MDNLTFQLPEILSLIGLAQCVYVLVYMVFRAGEVKRAAIPFVYFLTIGAAFFFDASYRFIGEDISFYYSLQWAAWFLGPPLSVLLIIQVARIYRMPAFYNYWVLALIPIAFLVSKLLVKTQEGCDVFYVCEQFHEFLLISGLVAGALSLLTIWLRRDVLEEIYAFKGGTKKSRKERYWLVLTLIVVNVFFLASMLLDFIPSFELSDMQFIRTAFGIALVYLAGTSLFRIYPQSLKMIDRFHNGTEDLSDDEIKIAEKIESLLDLEKIYHDPGYSRAQLAQELEVSESMVSKVINQHFRKSFPQILNERRVEDAKRLLKQTNASVKIVSSEVGFNSTTSFNRVFKEIVGSTPSDYRKKNIA